MCIFKHKIFHINEILISIDAILNGVIFRIKYEAMSLYKVKLFNVFYAAI